jgi:cytochrome c biogenesis protein CcdA/glutaredoxin
MLTIFKKLSVLLFLPLLLLLTAFTVSASSAKTIYFFYGTGCPHCAVVEEYFQNEGIYEKYEIEEKEIYFDRENAVFYTNLMIELGVPKEERGVPAVVIGDSILTGDTPIIKNFTKVADEFLTREPEDLVEEHFDEQEKEKLDLTLAAVIVGSLVDAINPCEFAVLIILMTTILATGNAKKALKSGFFFAASIFISYFLMGLGLYKALSFGGFANIFFKIIGWLAIVLGILNLKDFFWYGKGFLMEVPLSWRPKLKSLIHHVTSPKGAFAIGFLVSLFLLPCTSGPYIVILGMLAKRVFDTQAILYLLLYNLLFVSPMVLITLAVYRGFNPQKAEEMRQKQLRTLHLIAGLLMLAMGFAVLRGWI